MGVNGWMMDVLPDGRPSNIMPTPSIIGADIKRHFSVNRGISRKLLGVRHTSSQNTIQQEMLESEGKLSLS